MPVIPLTLDTSSITACGNDFSFDKVFTRPFEALAKKGDLLFCYSTSGNSENVINAAKIAKRKGIIVIGFTGNHKASKLEKYCDEVFKSPSKKTPIIQEFHSLAGHEICSEVENNLFFKTK